MKIRFVNVTDGGSRLYLDDIQINGGLVTTTHEPGLTDLPVELFPNPATDQVRVQAKAGWGQPMQIRVFDALGRLLRGYGLASHTQLDLTGLSAGVLFFKIKSAGYAAMVRLVKE